MLNSKFHPGNIFWQSFGREVIKRMDLTLMTDQLLFELVEHSESLIQSNQADAEVFETYVHCQQELMNRGLVFITTERFVSPGPMPTGDTTHLEAALTFLESMAHQGYQEPGNLSQERTPLIFSGWDLKVVSAENEVDSKGQVPNS